jgi:hypothetical protein
MLGIASGFRVRSQREGPGMTVTCLRPAVAVLPGLSDSTAPLGGLMRNMSLLAAFLSVAVFATGLAISAAKAEDLSAELALSPKDHKYNSRACRGLRTQAKNYNDGLFQQKPESYALAAVVPGGSVGLLIYVQHKRESFKTKVIQACMTNPPDLSPRKD